MTRAEWSGGPDADDWVDARDEARSSTVGEVGSGDAVDGGFRREGPEGVEAPEVVKLFGELALEVLVVGFADVGVGGGTRPVEVFVDLGHGVMDEAMVEEAAYILAKM